MAVPAHVLLLLAVLAIDWVAFVHPPVGWGWGVLWLVVVSLALIQVGGLEALRWMATSSRWAVETRQGLTEEAALVAPRPWGRAALRLCAGCSLALLGLLVVYRVAEPWSWPLDYELLFLLELYRLTPLGYAAVFLAPLLWVAAGGPARRGDTFVAGLALVASMGSILAAWQWMGGGQSFIEFLRDGVLGSLRLLLWYLHGCMVGGTAWWLAERCRG